MLSVLSISNGRRLKGSSRWTMTRLVALWVVSSIQYVSILTICQSTELRYVYQRIGFQCLSETLFEEAGNNFFAGDLDPRALISYYPDLRGSLFNEKDTLDIYAGVAEHMPPESSIDEISEYLSSPVPLFAFCFHRRRTTRPFH